MRGIFKWVASGLFGGMSVLMSWIVLIALPPVVVLVTLIMLMEFKKIPSLLPLHVKKLSASVTYDTFKDSRDGKKYRTIKMPDGRTWMAENLNYKTGKSWYYKDSFFGIPVRYKEYGRLYDWATAINACPNGWHVPSKLEWDNLTQAVKNDMRFDENDDTHGLYDVGKTLKAKRGWGWGKKYNGTNDYGFSALPGGNLPINGYYIGHLDFGNGGNYGYYGYWWTSTEKDSTGRLYVMKIGYYNVISAETGRKEDGNSIRCVTDRP